MDTTPHFIKKAVSIVHAAFPDGIEPWRRGFLLRAFRSEFSSRNLALLAAALWENSADESWTTLYEAYTVDRISYQDHEVRRCVEEMIPFGFSEFMDSDDL